MTLAAEIRAALPQEQARIAKVRAMMNRAQRREVEQQVADSEAMLSHPMGHAGFVRPAFPYENPTVLNTAGKPLTQAEYDKLVRLCQTHGLLIE